MRFAGIMSFLLLSAATASAAVIPELAAPSMIQERAPDLALTNEVRLWHSKKNGIYQVRMLGGMRMIRGFAEAFRVTETGVDLAKSFFEHFIYRSDLLGHVRNRLYRNLFALFKAAPEGAVVGLQFEIGTENDPANPLEIANFLQLVRDYFGDNPDTGVHEEYVSDAFNIGGPFQQGPLQRRGGGVVERNTCPVMFDFISAFRRDVGWDPHSPILAWPMCTELPSGPSKI